MTKKLIKVHEKIREFEKINKLWEYMRAPVHNIMLTL